MSKECLECNGRGTVECVDCSGSGYDMNDNYCTICDYGTVECTYCEGSGEHRDD